MNAFKGFLVASALMAGGAIFPSATLAQTGAVGPPQLEAGQSMGRALGIASVPNLRDVGGYRTDDDGIVARGLVYRSDTFHPMSDADVTRLKTLGLRNDFDLRTTAEVKAKPDRMPPGVQYHMLNVLADARSAAPAEIDALMHEPKKANVALGGGKIEKKFTDA